MKTVSAREANQAFSKLLNEVAAGEDVVITRRGAPVARLTPFGAATVGREMTAERAEAVQRLMEHLRNAPKMDLGPWKRDELYDR